MKPTTVGIDYSETCFSAALGYCLDTCCLM